MAPPPLPRAISFVASVGLLIVLASHAFIDLEVALDLPLGAARTWSANGPVADVVALVLLGLVLLAWRLLPLAPPCPPGLAGWLLLLVASLLSVRNALDPAEAMHHLLRKPVLVYLLYGVGLAWLVATLVPRRRVQAMALLALSGIALFSASTSIGRILAGDTLWYQSLAGLTPNHKTLAVCLAGWLPLVLGWARETGPVLAGPSSAVRRGARWALPLVGVAILASASKTAWLGAGLALALHLPTGRPLAWRPRLFVPLLALGLALSYYSPLLLRSRTMLDAARSRHSLNERAWVMLRAHPLVGSGTGMSTRFEMVTFPHYRVNGVDAHGAPQKVAAETGLLGLLGLGLFVTQAGRRLLSSWRGARAAHPTAPATALPSYEALATFAVLHGQLLLSTELFSPTHWVPLATAWGLAEASRTAPPEDPCAS